MKEKTYHTRCGTIHYWASVSNPDEITLVFSLIRVRKHSWDNIIQGKQ